MFCEQHVECSVINDFNIKRGEKINPTMFVDVKKQKLNDSLLAAQLLMLIDPKALCHRHQITNFTLYAVPWEY